MHVTLAREKRGAKGKYAGYRKIAGKFLFNLSYQGKTNFHDTIKMRIV